MPTLKRYRHAHTLTLASYPGYREPLNIQRRRATAPPANPKKSLA